MHNDRLDHIRNFCIIAHIDHGKSTLADRLLEMTGVFQRREMVEQVLDSMELERERGITIKSKAVHMTYQAKDGETYTLNLIDTAGVHSTEDAIEKMGIDRSMQAMEKAQLIIVVLDGSEAMTEDDQQLLAMTENRNRIVVYNKADQKKTGDVSISAKNKQLDELITAIQEKYEKELNAADTDTLNNERQIGLAMQAEKSMQDVVTALKNGVELDLVTIDLENAWTALREITGKSGKEDLLDEIFSRFCLGK